MALTKAQVSLVTVSTLGIAPGSYYADLADYDSQLELAEMIESVDLLAAGTNAEYALQVAENVGGTASQSAVTELFDALEDGVSRAEATLDFANNLLLENNAALNARISMAVAFDEDDTFDFETLSAALVEEIIEAEDDGLTIEFVDDEEDQSEEENSEGQTVVNIGKAQLDAGTGEISSDFTFQLADQIGAGDQFEGLFLSPIIEREAAEQTGSQVVLELRNLREASDSDSPLYNLPTNGIAFTLDGVILKVADSDDSSAIDDAQTYEELRDALAARLVELSNGIGIPDGSAGESSDAADYAKLATFSVALGETFTAKNQAGTTVAGTEIVMTDAAGAELVPLAFTQSEGLIVQTGYTLYGELKTEGADTVSKLITTNLELENVGYGSQGGSVNIAGQSNSDKGVEEIKVTAQDGVWLSRLTSEAATHHLERIELQTGSNGYFRVGTQKNSNVHLVDLEDQNFDTAGLLDVQQLDAVAAGSVAINSAISDDVLTRYDLDDTSSYTADDEQGEIAYTLTSGNDVLRLAVDVDVLEQVDTTVTIDAGEGNDQVIFTAFDGFAIDGTIEAAASSGEAWVVNQNLLDNVSIDAGAGDDWVITTGAGSVNIDAGTGDDTIRTDNSGAQRAVYVFNNDTTDIEDLQSNSHRTIANDANGVAQTFNFFNATVTVTFMGFESEAIEIDSTDYTTNTKQINQAIKDAVNNDPVLNKLIWAIDNEGNALGIESLIDGALATGDLDITITVPVEDDITAADLEAAAEAYGLDPDTFDYADLDDGTDANALYATEFGTSGGVVDGKDSDAESDNMVIAGKGDDVITLGTGADSNDTLKFEGYNNGTDSIVNFSASVVSTSGGVTTQTDLIFANATTEFVVATTADGEAVSAGTDVAQVFEMKFSNVTAGDTNLTFVNAQQFGTIGAGADLVIDVSAGMTAAELTAAILTGSAGVIGDFAVTAHPTDSSILIFTSDTAGTGVDADVTDLVNGGASVTTDADVVFTAEETTDAVDGLGATVGDTEEFTVTIGASAVADGNITFDGETIPVLDGDSANDIAASLAAGTYANWTAVAVANVVTFTSVSADTSITDVEFDDFGGLISSSTSPVVNTNVAASDFDLLDFTSYLTSADEFGARLNTDLITASNFTAGNQVKVVDFADDLELDGDEVTFSSLTASILKSMLNGTEDADNAFGNLDIDADDIAAAGQDQDYVLMVQNHENDGEYKVFHLTAEADNDAAFATVSLVGTLDFGAEQTFIDANFTGSAVVA